MLAISLLNKLTRQNSTFVILPRGLKDSVLWSKAGKKKDLWNSASRGCLSGDEFRHFSLVFAKPNTSLYADDNTFMWLEAQYFILVCFLLCRRRLLGRQRSVLVGPSLSAARHWLPWQRFCPQRASVPRRRVPAAGRPGLLLLLHVR